MIAEGEDALGIGHRRVVAELGAEERLGHRRHVLVREADVGADEERVARLDRDDAELPRLASTMACAARIFSHRVIGRAGVVIVGG